MDNQKERELTKEDLRLAHQATLGAIAKSQQDAKKWMNISFIITPCLILSLLINVLLGMKGEKIKFIAVTPDLRVVELTPLKEPYVSQNGLLNWATETVTQAMSLDYLKYKSQLTAVRPRFSEAAFAEFIRSIKDADILDFIKERRLMSRIALERAPTITKQGVVKGKYTWFVEIPVALSYESSEGVQAAQHLIALIKIQRCPALKNPQGVEIQQLVFKNA